MSPMAEDNDGPIHRWTPLDVRIEAVERFADCTEHVLTVGDLQWADVAKDFRLLAVNCSLRRQQESIRAAILLRRHDLGHLGVAFVRAALEDLMYLGFFASLDLEESRELFMSVGSFDPLRALLAHRNYLGDKEMARLRYPSTSSSGQNRPECWSRTSMRFEGTSPPSLSTGCGGCTSKPGGSLCRCWTGPESAATNPLTPIR